MSAFVVDETPALGLPKITSALASPSIAAAAEPALANQGQTLQVAWRLVDKDVLVIGGGDVAAGRVVKLLESGARVRVVARRFRWSFHRAIAPIRERLELVEEAYADHHLQGAELVFCAIDDADVSAQIAMACRRRRIPANIADRPALCDFYLCAQVRQGPVHLSISTDGQAPALAVRLRDEISRALPKELEAAVQGFQRLRRRALSAAWRDVLLPKQRMKYLRQVAKRLSWAELARLSDARIERILRQSQLPNPLPEPQGSLAARHKTAGTKDIAQVLLVGAGPGDPELLTRAALSAIQDADLVLADRLIPKAILDLVVGELYVAEKFPGMAAAAQKELDRRLVAAAKAGKKVIRLKCGDPGLFGRAGEELALLADNGIQAQVIPGISSVHASIAAANGSLTLRGLADRVLICTVRGRGGKSPRLPDFDGECTFAFLMGVAKVAELVHDLGEKGFPMHLPVLCAAKASQAEQVLARTTLGALPRTITEAKIKAPATFLMGWALAQEGIS